MLSLNVVHVPKYCCWSLCSLFLCQCPKAFPTPANDQINSKLYYNSHTLLFLSNLTEFYCDFKFDEDTEVELETRMKGILKVKEFMILQCVII